MITQIISPTVSLPRHLGKMFLRKSLSGCYNIWAFNGKLQNISRHFTTDSHAYNKHMENITQERSFINGPYKQTIEDNNHYQDDKHCSYSTYSENEVNKFRLTSQTWWDKHGEFMALHSLNKLRVALVRDGLIESKASLRPLKMEPLPLNGLRLLDVGCGGGILSEPLARLGAHVTGLDAASENIAVAELHAKKYPQISSNLRYVQGTIEEHVSSLEEKYDGIIASEVVEHVQSVEFFIDSCISALKPGGSLFITTINKTTRSWLAAIVAAEYVLGIVPRGTHDWNKFIGPRELRFMVESAGCRTKLVHGMLYIPGCNKWFWIPDTSVNYALHAVKPKEHHE